MIYLRFKARKIVERRTVHKQAHAKLKKHINRLVKQRKIREQREAYKNSRKN